MREPLHKFPKRPTGPDQARRTLAECQALLANTRLSPEMRHALEQRVIQLKAELEADATNRARDASSDADEARTSRPPRK